MNKKKTSAFAPAYVFCYTERTKIAFRNAQSVEGKKFAIDAQNSAPPFDALVTSAWLTKDGEKLQFENGSPTAVISICYVTLMHHIDVCLAAAPAESGHRVAKTVVT
ncbi:hypothetical protein [Janthinobacterium sp. PAMC25594]|uniref:hypothetical protein n=1 Tax=Janthinobacterium sp. PAMC25594 TaxID=2861284 RepID=UPI001C63321B|nr:hypothetical protein [Janthinobacterium sp. PAMC25594]QYG08977.1 hypothetical protein KY494_09665 [Janthinobacterium sp. PAMC25594]